MRTLTSFQQNKFLQDHHARLKDAARTSENAETTKTDATEQQKEPEQKRPENATTRRDLARTGDAEPNGLRMQELHQADHLEPLS